MNGTKEAIGRKGFAADIKVLASVGSEEMMEACGMAKPRDSISTPCARPEMPTKVKTALRTLLPDTSDVPSTEGRKSQLRFNGHGNNLFGASSFFNTQDFADTCAALCLSNCMATLVSRLWK